MAEPGLSYREKFPPGTRVRVVVWRINLTTEDRMTEDTRDILQAKIEKLNREALDAHIIMTAQHDEIERLTAALKPFAGAVYNDNGSMTISPVSNADAYRKAYFVMRGHQQKASSEGK